MSAEVLIVDDERAVRFALREVLEARGYAVREAEQGEAALAMLDGVDLVVTDLAMPRLDGLGLLRELRARDAQLPVIVVTARGSERVAVEAMKAGALDYLAKPFDVDELTLAVARALETASLRRDARRASAERHHGVAWIGESPASRALLASVERLARREIPVLVRGETGTGKELVATMLHALGPRARGPLVRFNCAAVPTELAEAELFGHARGAFTGAKDARAGFFARAHGGTLVLDEVGELPVALQPKLLRALQQGEIQPIGAGRVDRVDVRVVACTHRDLREDARAGKFREDLYYRLAVVELPVPPLRARRDEIPALAHAFAARYAARFGLDGARLAPSLIDALARRDWPGNVRELENAVARMLALSDGGEIGLSALGQLEAPAALEDDAGDGSFRGRVEAYERRLIGEAMRAADGNRAEAARRLGLSRVTLLDRMRRLGLG